jgi:hypothetical protein
MARSVVQRIGRSEAKPSSSWNAAKDGAANMYGRWNAGYKESQSDDVSVLAPGTSHEDDSDVLVRKAGPPRLIQAKVDVAIVPCCRALLVLESGDRW